MISLISTLQSGLGSSYVMQSRASTKDCLFNCYIRKKNLNYLYTLKDFSLNIVESGFDLWSSSQILIMQ